MATTYPVQITVTETGTASSKTIQVQINEDPIDLTDRSAAGPGNAAIDIVWSINSVGGGGRWSFDHDVAAGKQGIVIMDPGTGAQSGKFDHVGPPNVLNKQFKCKRRAGQGTVNEKCKYSIRITDGAQVVVLDPSIINQP